MRDDLRFLFTALLRKSKHSDLPLQKRRRVGRHIWAGAHLRVWRGVIAHDLLVGYRSSCFHSPGPGESFREDDLTWVVKNDNWLEVVSHAANEMEVSLRSERARSLKGWVWDALASNCQDTLSWITTGRVRSFQRDAALALGLAGFMMYLASKPDRRLSKGKR